MTEQILSEVEAAVEAAAKAFHDAVREKQYLRWETSSEIYRAEIRELVRPAAVAAFVVGAAGATQNHRRSGPCPHKLDS